MDAICQVVRCFADDNITHVSGKVDPIDDIETINLELILLIWNQLKNGLAVLKNWLKQKDKDAVAEFEVLSMLRDAFEAEKPARTVEFTEEQLKIAKGLHLINDQTCSLCGQC